MLSNQIALTHQNVLSYCGLVDAKMKASDKDLPVSEEEKNIFVQNCCKKLRLF